LTLGQALMQKRIVDTGRSKHCPFGHAEIGECTCGMYCLYVPL
jgi:hypothetical protein